MPKSEGARSPLKPPRSPIKAALSASPVGAEPIATSAAAASSSPTAVTTTSERVGKKSLPKFAKLLIGAGGIYGAFLYYGNLQEDVFDFTSPTGEKFKYAWFLQVLEALANVLVGGLALALTGFTKNLPQQMFAISGASQMSAKAFTSLALASGVSFPVVTLAKSGKMVPVMLGSLLLGNAKYSVREYASVLAIIVGTVIVSLGKKSNGKGSSMLGIGFIVLSLVCDGLTGGLQKKLKYETSIKGVKPKPYDFMFWTNLYMAVTALGVSLFIQELIPGFQFCMNNPQLMEKILKFAACSAVGQSFIFYTISNFDPLVCSTVTTTRKVFSVLLSILLKGHSMSTQGWAGLALASGGVLSELLDKADHSNKKDASASSSEESKKQK